MTAFEEARREIEERYKERFPNGIPAGKTTVEKLIAVSPAELHEKIWARWKRGDWPKHEVLKLIEEVKEARKRLPAQPPEMKLRALAQTAARTREEIDEDMRNAAAEESRRKMYEQTLHTWIEMQYANQRQAEAWRDRYDPCGLWGPATLASRD